MLTTQIIETPPWWTQTTVYQVYPRSFADGNGDGIGDLQGLIDRLDYLESLGVETLWLSPVYDSPQTDFGYDIRDHFEIAAEYGTMADVHALIAAVHARGMKLVFDMVLNHTSAEHAWFRESRSSRESPKRSWYLWRDGRRPHGASPPNNWKAVVGGSGWHYDAQTGQWYWSSFLPFQPDLNYRNPEVKAAMLAVVRYWLDQGVDGLRLDLFNAIYKDASFANNPRSLRPFPTEDNPHGFFQRNAYTIDHADTLAFARELRAVVDASPLPPRFLVGEVFGSVEDVRRYCHGEGQGPGLHLVFLFKAMSTAFTAPALRGLVEEVERVFRAPLVPTWVFSNHDRPRSLLRLGGDVRKAKLLAMFQLTARGVPFIYYGEELGTAHGNIPLAAAQDPIAHKFRHIPGWLARGLRRRGVLLNRDECRLPMAWTSAVHAGFSPETSPPWLTQRGPAAGVNVEAEDARPDSLLWVYRTLLALRAERVSLHGGTLELDPAYARSKHLLAYRRVAEGTTTHAFLNMSGKIRPVALPKSPLRVYSTLRGWRDDPTDGVLLPFEGVVAFAP